jgi:hypothetical protein
LLEQAREEPGTLLYAVGAEKHATWAYTPRRP